MRTMFAFLDYGQGWENITSHLGDQAALSGVSVEWGASNMGERPDVAVARLGVHDRTGWLAGRAATLAGTLVALQITRSPFWSDLQQMLMPADSTWRDRTETWATLHEPVEPDPSSPPDWKDATTLFIGTLSVGTTITPRDDGGEWDVDLYAQSLTVQLSRAQVADQGGQPAVMSSVWSGTVPVLYGRIRQVIDGMPDAVRPVDGITLPDAGGATLLGWDTVDQDPDVTAWDVLDMLTSWNPELPQWFETHLQGEILPRIKPVYEAAEAVVTLTDATTVVDAAGMTVTPVTMDRVIDDTGSLESPTPTASLSITGLTATPRTEDVVVTPDDPDTPDVDETVTDTVTVGIERRDTAVGIDAPDLPGIIGTLGDTLEVDSLIAMADNTGLGITGWTPDTTQQERARDFLRAINSRLVPGIRVSTRSLDIDTNTHAYLPEPTLWWIHDTKFNLQDAEGGNPVDGVYMSIGGTLTFTRSGDTTLLEHAPTIIPMHTAINDQRSDNG